MKRIGGDANRMVCCLLLLLLCLSDLSAVSQENAASSEESSASMEELNATFTTISDSAEKLRQLAHDMDETISFFNI